MKVGIDISSLHKMSQGRGIGFYTENLIKALKEYTDVDVIVLEKGQTENVDLIHFPFFDFFRPTLKITEIPSVVTIHDVIPLLFPKHYPAGIKGKINLFRQKQSLKKVKAVITDSKSSTTDAVKVLKLPAEKVKTVYLAPSDNFKKLADSEIKKILGKFNLPEKFILYSGGVNWNKNLINQTEAVLKTEFDLCLVGGGFETKDNLSHPELREFKEFLEKYQNNPRIHILGFVGNTELAALMNAAQALVFVSRYEGFGLPILEAQSCGTPVITGNTSSMLEVGENSAVFADPGSVSEIAEKLMYAVKNKDQLIKKGFENLKRFSWKKTALETAQVYKHVLD